MSVAMEMTLISSFTGKNKNLEVDFVAEKNGRREYYQVTYLLASEETVAREFGAFSGISDNYPKYVISLDKQDFSRNGIKHINVIDFFMNEEF